MQRNRKKNFLSWLILIAGTWSAASSLYAQERKVIVDSQGAIIRGDTTVKEISLVLTGDSFADGGDIIRKILKKGHVPAAFFLTGNFYSNPANAALVKSLKQDGH